MVVDISLGQAKLDWASSHMPIHKALARRFEGTRPFAGLTVAVSSHLEAKTGVLIETLAKAGGRVVFTASVAATAQHDVAAALNTQPGIEGFIATEADGAALSSLRDKVIARQPSLVIDDGAEIALQLLRRPSEIPNGFIGVCEQTTSGVQRLRALGRQGQLKFPVLAVNDSYMKREFDNVHGTGESVLTNLLLVTNRLLAGRRLVVAGFGYCGEGIAQRAKAWGARVSVTEVDPRKAVRAHVQGFDVVPMREAVLDADFILTATGMPDVLRREHFLEMADGVVLGNVGHFSNEINLDDLHDLAIDRRDVRPGIREYKLHNGRCINVVADAELVNLASPVAMGHPIEIMDITMAMLFLSALYMVEHRQSIRAAVHAVPEEVDHQVAEIELSALGVVIDGLTANQHGYSSS